MAFTFILGSTPPGSMSTQNSTPRHASGRPRTTHSRGRNGMSDRLGVIMEDDDSASAQPPSFRSHRSFGRRSEQGDLPPISGHDRPPPPYSQHADVERSSAEKLQRVRDYEPIARRGGWWRVMLVSIVLVVVVIGLVTGLVMGLRKKYQNGATPTTQSPSPSGNPNAAFPSGSYALSTYLQKVDTSCSNNPNTWRCYPYQTYHESTTSSLVTFNWIVASKVSSSGQRSFSISSSENPFALIFKDVPLELHDAGQPMERYAFQTSIDKTVIPAGPVGDDRSLINCFYNATTFQGLLYTKRPRPSNATSATSASPSSSSLSGASNGTEFQPWPYAIEVTQSIVSGPGRPDCQKMANGRSIGPVAASLAGTGGTCSCQYRDPDT